MAQALLNGSPRGLFVEIEHPDGTAYLCTGVGTRQWNGQTWQGAGKFGTVTPIKHNSDIAVQDITFALSGIDPTILSQLDDNVRNLTGKAWLACFDEADNVIADPYQIVDSQLDYQTLDISDEDGTATVSIIAHSGFYTLDRGVDEAWTPENQKLTYPTDVGMDQIPGLQKQDIQWKPS